MGNKHRADRLGIVQFIHPGKEQTRHTKGWCPWGKVTNPHHRKFIVNEASFIRDGINEHGVCGLWGEWEGPSRVRVIPGPHQDPWPKVFHTIAHYEPESYDGLWDTDPFVFGDRFLYNGCQQHTGHGRANGPTGTLLRYLAPGSIILFGSSVLRRFVLDTAFVVGTYDEYENWNYDHLDVPPEYLGMGLVTQALIEPDVPSFRLYQGATYDEGIEGMFSFTPCRSMRDGYVEFPRPNIQIPGVITQSLTQGKKMTDAPDLKTMRGWWLEVLKQVYAAGCYPAHRVELNPERVNGEQHR